ncbi:MAG: hypothetical protein CPDRYMAC_6380 [uncultured Paraburkholderia sp.]|nr:MAG: hypothetical protein CPDRYDRY_6282 [uncultured Paraburkholderia sp.]CAH2944207.1 MAG: hypothetical protein CPDRYMAC_6380 [uncultured Paraburkholderia sp.]
MLLQCLGQLPKPLDRPEQDIAALWLAACVQSLNDAEYGTRDDRAWARANLAELYLIAPFVEGLPQPHVVESSSDKPIQFVRKIVSLTGSASFHVFSTRRQLLRYIEWFMPMTQCTFAANDALTTKMLDVLPACDEPEWDY